jgi:hypothetical protein
MVVVVVVDRRKVGELYTPIALDLFGVEYTE